MKSFLDADHPTFARAWVRWATTLFPLVWGAVEFAMGSPGWGILFLGAGAWAGYVLIVKGPTGKRPSGEEQSGDGPTGPSDS